MNLRRSYVLAFVGSLILLNCFLLWLWRNNTSKEFTPVIILKLPRSGSSWFTSLLNQYDFVYITKEVIQGKDKGRVTPDAELNHLVKALVEPSPKIAFSAFKYFSGRYWEDYILKGKYQSSLRLLGFTLNPEHVPDLDWAKLLKLRSRTRLVILVRSNMVKSAVSSRLGDRQKRICGMSNTRNSTAVSSFLLRGMLREPECILGKSFSTLNWTVAEYQSEVNSWVDRYRRFYLQIQKQIVPFLATQPIIVRYETLQQNPSKIIESLLENLVPGALNTRVQSSMTLGTSEWVKRSPENLRRVLPRFDRMHDSLAHTSCEPLRRQLEADSAQVFDPSESLLQVRNGMSPYSCDLISELSTIQAMFQQSIVL